MVAHCDSLVELSQAVITQVFAQFRLPNQDHLNQLVFFRFQVGQKPYLLKNFRREILCFINDQERGPVGLVLRQQKLVERVNQVRVAETIIGNAKFPIDIAQKFESCQLGIEDECDSIFIFIKVRKKCTQDSRFTGTNLAGHFDKTGPVFNAVNKMCVYFVVGFAEEKEARVRCQGKRLFLEGKKRFIHKPNIPLQAVQTLRMLIYFLNLTIMQVFRKRPLNEKSFKSTRKMNFVYAIILGSLAQVP